MLLLKLRWWLLNWLIGRDTVIFNTEIIGDLHAITQSPNSQCTFCKNFGVRDVDSGDIRPVVPTPEPRVVH